MHGDVAIPDPLGGLGAVFLPDAAAEGVAAEFDGLAVGTNDLGQHAGAVPLVLTLAAVGQDLLGQAWGQVRLRANWEYKQAYRPAGRRGAWALCVAVPSAP